MEKLFQFPPNSWFTNGCCQYWLIDGCCHGSAIFCASDPKTRTMVYEAILPVKPEAQIGILYEKNAKYYLVL